MRNSTTTFADIVSRSTNFSEEIDQLIKRKDLDRHHILKKEETVEDDILSTAKNLYCFLQETISYLSDLYRKISDEENKILLIVTTLVPILMLISQ